MKVDIKYVDTVPDAAQQAVLDAIQSPVQVTIVLASFGTGKTTLECAFSKSLQSGPTKRSVAISCTSNKNAEDVWAKLTSFGIKHVLVRSKEKGGEDHYGLHDCIVFVADSYHRVATGYDDLLVEESVQHQAIQVLKTVLHQKSLVTIVLLGDHAQLPPVVNSCLVCSRRLLHSLS